jgi:exosortase
MVVLSFVGIRHAILRLNEMLKKSSYIILFAGLSLLTTWAYLPALLKASERWASDPQYSHGYIIPLFSLFLLYHRRAMLDITKLRPSWWGILPLAVSIGLRWLETGYFFNGLELLSIVPALWGGVLLTGGRSAFRWAWLPILFLIFMVPLPFRLQTALSGQLQSLATQLSTYSLVTLGVPAISEGNIILVEDVRIGVVDACSGLGMMVTFAALTGAFLSLYTTSWWVKVGLLLGALPVAVIANVLRITATAILFHANRAESARALYHDLAGWIMIPVGILLIAIELRFLQNLIKPVEKMDGVPAFHLPMSGSNPRPTPSSGPSPPAAPS